MWTQPQHLSLSLGNLALVEKDDSFKSPGIPLRANNRVFPLSSALCLVFLPRVQGLELNRKFLLMKTSGTLEP